jgi:hypothetical protein
MHRKVRKLVEEAQVLREYLRRERQKHWRLMEECRVRREQLTFERMRCFESQVRAGLVVAAELRGL